MRSDADVAYEKVREICLHFPGADEKLSHGMPSFHVRGKMFAHFIDNSHGGAKKIAVWCKTTHAEQRRLVASDKARFFVPPYVGVSGWVGIDVDPARADWIALAMIIEEAWVAVAPPKIVSGEIRAPKIPKKAPPVRVTTDRKIANDAFEKFSKICLALPECECEHDAQHGTFRVRKKVFAYFLNNHHGDGFVAACVKGDKRENARLIARDPKRYYAPAYLGSHGYLGIRLDLPRVDWNEVRVRVDASWRSSAPKKLVAPPKKKSKSR